MNRSPRPVAVGVAAALAALSAVSLSLLVTAPAFAQAAAAAPASAAASAPPFAVRPDVATALNQAVELFRGGKLAEAKARVEQAQAATTAPQAAEVTVMHRLHGLLAMQLGQLEEASKSLEAAMAVNVQAPKDQLTCEESLTQVKFNLKDYAGAIDWARKAQSHGSQSAGVQAVLVRATYVQKDYPGTISLLEAQEKAVGKLTVDELRILASAYGQIKDDTNYLRLIERLLREHGRIEYWPDLLSRVPRQASWQPRWDVDLMRLRLKLDQMDDANDYMVLADTVSRAGRPAEAQGVLDAGFAKGLLGKGSGAAEQQKLRAAVTKQANDDRKSLLAASSGAPQVADARSAMLTFNTGAAMVAAGQAERGLELMKAAVGGPLADPMQARLQYGQALAQAGRAADAAEQFKIVGAADGIGLLGRLWGAATTGPAPAPTSAPASAPAAAKG
jgi:tetratricopeptide (TPR) repeat protein